jgi:hypothetical protein
MPGFHRGLSEVGYVEGQNVALESRFAENHVETIGSVAVAALVANNEASPPVAKITATW